jgi:hypothetical protein
LRLAVNGATGAVGVAHAALRTELAGAETVVLVAVAAAISELALARDEEAAQVRPLPCALGLKGSADERATRAGSAEAATWATEASGAVRIHRVATAAIAAAVAAAAAGSHALAVCGVAAAHAGVGGTAGDRSGALLRRRVPSGEEHHLLLRLAEGGLAVAALARVGRGRADGSADRGHGDALLRLLGGVAVGACDTVGLGVLHSWGELFQKTGEVTERLLEGTKRGDG